MDSTHKPLAQENSLIPTMAIEGCSLLDRINELENEIVEMKKLLKQASIALNPDSEHCEESTQWVRERLARYNVIKELLS